MAKFQVMPTVGAVTHTFRIGGLVASNLDLTDADIGKAVTLGANSQVNLAGADDEIFGFLRSVEPGVMDGYRLGGVQIDLYAEVDTGSLTAGDTVIAKASPARGTAGMTEVKAGDSQWVVVEKNVILKV